MNIVAFAASNSSKSINLQLIKSIIPQFTEHNVKVLDLNDYEMPIYSEDRNSEGVPQQAIDFLNELNHADAILISLAEHNSTFSAAFKNIFDWTSRVEREMFANKPMMLLSTSPGARGGQSVLDSALSIFPRFGGNIISKYAFPNFYDNFANGEINNKEVAELLNKEINTFKASLA